MTSLLSAFEKLSPRRKILSGVLLVGLLGLGIGIPYIIQSQPIPSRKISLDVVSPTPIYLEPVSPHLNFSTHAISYTVGETVTVDILLDAENNDVGAADFVVKYDPTILKALSITQGSFFKKMPVKKISNSMIKISALAQVNNDMIIFPKGQGTVATLAFKVLKPSSDAKISFDPEATIIASNGRNIIDTFDSLTLITHE